MPIKDAGKKAMRSDVKKRVKNLRRSRTLKGLVKEVKGYISAGDKKKAQEKMPQVQKAIDKATKAGVLKKNTASRKKSRLSSAIKKIS